MSLQSIVVGTRHCRVLRLYHSDANGIDIISKPISDALIALRIYAGVVMVSTLRLRLVRRFAQPPGFFTKILRCGVQIR